MTPSSSEQRKSSHCWDTAAETCLLVQSPSHSWPNSMQRKLKPESKDRVTDDSGYEHVWLGTPLMKRGIRRTAALGWAHGQPMKWVPSRQGRAQGHPGGQWTLACLCSTAHLPHFSLGTGLLPSSEIFSSSPQGLYTQGSLPARLFAPHSMWVTPIFLLISNGC